MQLPGSLQPVLEVLYRAYPDGLPDSDYMPLLAFLGEEMSERNLAAVVAEFVGGETVVVANDAAAAIITRPLAVHVRRVRHRLEAGGWEYDELSPPRAGQDRKLGRTTRGLADNGPLGAQPVALLAARTNACGVDPGLRAELLRRAERDQAAERR